MSDERDPDRPPTGRRPPTPADRLSSPRRRPSRVGHAPVEPTPPAADPPRRPRRARRAGGPALGPLGAARARSGDHTQPVDLSHTQELRGPPGPAPPAPSADRPGVGRRARPAGRSTPRPARRPAADAPPAARAAEPTGFPQPSRPARPTRPPSRLRRPTAGAGWDPITSPDADAGYAGQPAPWVGQRPPEATAPQQKGPGWGALVAVAAIAALIAASLGGVFGGWLGATGRVDFGRLDRTPSSIPSAGAGSTARPGGLDRQHRGQGAAERRDHQGRRRRRRRHRLGLRARPRRPHHHQQPRGRQRRAAAAPSRSSCPTAPRSTPPSPGGDGSYDLAVLKTGRTDLVPLVMGVVQGRRRRRPGDRRRCAARPRVQRHQRHRQRPQPPGEPGRRRQPAVLHQRHPDRRGDQPRQQRRPAAQHGRAGHRRELRHRPHPRQPPTPSRATSASASRSPATRSSRRPSSSSRPARRSTRSSGWCSTASSPATGVRILPKAAATAAVRRSTPKGPAGKAGHQGRRRHRRVRRPQGHRPRRPRRGDPGQERRRRRFDEGPPRE